MTPLGAPPTPSLTLRVRPDPHPEPRLRRSRDAVDAPLGPLAARFAAKEAISKALGTGFRHGVWIRDLGFKANAWGKPEVIFSARGRAVADRLGAGDGHVSLTDEAGLVTDGKFTRASVLPEAYEALAKSLSKVKGVPVVTGFVGRDREGNVTTLGRSGSDYTATIVGRARAERRHDVLSPPAAWRRQSGILAPLFVTA